MENCLFCKIIRGEIPSTKVYEDENTYAFRDIAPQAPTHVVVVPKCHVSGMNETDKLTDAQIAACLHTCREVAKITGINESGYRVITNCGSDACQSVQHLHFHVVGGKKMSESMA